MICFNATLLYRCHFKKKKKHENKGTGDWLISPSN